MIPAARSADISVLKECQAAATFAKPSRVGAIDAEAWPRLPDNCNSTIDAKSGSGQAGGGGG